MSRNLRALIKQHHAFYEVLPYYAVVKDANGGLWLTIHRVHAGFDIDIYGESPIQNWVIPGPDPNYTLGDSELQKISEELSCHSTHSCTLEILAFPAKAVFEVTQNRKRCCVSEFHIAGLSMNRRNHHNNARPGNSKKKQSAWVSHDDDKQNNEVMNERFFPFQSAV